MRAGAGSAHSALLAGAGLLAVAYCTLRPIACANPPKREIHRFRARLRAHPMDSLVFNQRAAMFSKLLSSSRRVWHRTSPVRRQAVVAQAHGQIMLLDCQWHEGWWTGVVKIRDA